MSADIDATLAERGEQYGNFLDQASLACSIKRILHRGRSWEQLAPDQQEALDFIAVKISRILTGNPNHFDGWHDIAGYAELVAKRIKPK